MFRKNAFPASTRKPSVVIPSYGGAARLPWVLEALEAQQGAEPEVIVVLDGDIDGSAAVVAAYADRLDVRAVVLPENRGRAAALNAGFAAATGDVLIRCDDDLRPHPSFVANHVRHHEGGAVGVVGACPDVFPDSPYAAAYGRPADSRVRARWRQLPAHLRWTAWSANVSIDRETHDRVGRYDEEFAQYGWEDVEWGYRLHSLGVPIIVAEDVEATHHGPATTTSQRALKAYDSGISRRAFLEKHPDAAPYFATAGSNRASAWGRLVQGTASRLTTPERVTTLASRVDRVLGRLPRPVAEKAVALTVEAAGKAGSAK